jgi:hypothetical protein
VFNSLGRRSPLVDSNKAFKNLKLFCNGDKYAVEA